MSKTSSSGNITAWNKNLLFLLRIIFVYFLIQIIPLDLKFYKQISRGNLPGLHYGDIFNIAHYYPSWFSNAPSFADWGVFLLFAVVIGIIWTLWDRNRTTTTNNNIGYDKLYYWFRVILRYRLSVAVIAYGFIKLFPLQAPYPSISNLNTNYGDFTRWKLFGLSLGIVPSYQSFLGAVEILLGLLLLNRKTASIAAFIIIVFTGNVFMSNLAYEGGEVVYSLFLISLAFFILLYDLQRIINLLILQKPTAPNRFHPSFFQGWRKYVRLGLKTAFILLFVVIYGFKTHSGYRKDQFQYPNQRGLPGFAGIYNVSRFAIGGDTLVYSKLDPVRWTDVVFEKWNTISIRSNRPVIIDSTNIDKISRIDQERSYEYEGSAGRHYYSYKTDTTNHLLTLQNRNPHYATEQILLNYDQVNDSTIVLSGTDQDRLPIYAVLQKINKKYLLQEVEKRGRRKSFKL